MSSVATVAKTTSTERMRLKKLRDLGKLPALQTCNACGKTLKLSKNAQNKAAAQGLCHACWRQTPDYKEERARQNSQLVSRQPVRNIRPIAYFGAQPGKPYKRYPSARKAHSACYVGKGKLAGVVVVCWSDGRVIGYWGRTAAGLLGITPDDGDVVIDEPCDFYKLMKPAERAPFEAMQAD